MKWTGPQIIKQLPDISVFCSGIGTSGKTISVNVTRSRANFIYLGSMTGTGLYLKQERQRSLTTVG